MLTVQEGMVAGSCLLGLGFGLFRHAYPFFAVSAPIEAEILVIDGWMPDYALEQAVLEVQRGAYRTIVTLGTPITHGSYLSEYKNLAEIAAATLVALGISRDMIVPLVVPYAQQNRTYTAALTLKQWLQQEGVDVKAINLYTLGPHARRSWLLFRRVLAPEVRAGVIAAEPRDYDPQRWWRFSAGARSVISEAIGYGYARLVRPSI